MQRWRCTTIKVPLIIFSAFCSFYPLLLQPNSWNAYDSLAEASELNGNTKEALTNYKIARTKAPEDQHKRLDATIARLSGK
jgi:hypothetical protein